MAFDYTNLLETAAGANNGDFSFTDRAGNTADTVKAANNSGEWCEENGSTTSSGTGPSANPTGRSGFIYLEASSNVLSTVWAMKRASSYDASAVGVTINLIYNLNAETASNVIMEYATVASPNETTDWSIKETIACTLTDSWISDSWDFSAETTTTLWTRVRCETSNAFTNDIAFSTWNEVGVDKTTYEISGVTKDSAGSALGSCDVFLIRETAGDPVQVGYQVSNATTGAYSFTGLTTAGDQVYAIAFKDGTPVRMDTSGLLTPTVE